MISWVTEGRKNAIILWRSYVDCPSGSFKVTRLRCPSADPMRALDARRGHPKLGRKFHSPKPKVVGWAEIHTGRRTSHRPSLSATARNRVKGERADQSQSSVSKKGPVAVQLRNMLLVCIGYNQAHSGSLP